MPAVHDLELLRQCPLFKDLRPEHLGKLNDLLHRKVFPSGVTVMLKEQPGEVMYIILNGTVKITVEGFDGSQVILGIRGPGEVLGEISMLDNIGHSANVTTQEQATMLWIDRRAFWDCLQTMPPLMQNVARILSRRVRLATAQILSLATQDVYGRIAYQLLAFAQEYGENQDDGSIVIPLRLTQNDLAGMVGASRVRVNQVLVYWKRKKFISADENHHFTILNKNALAARCNQSAA